MRTHFRVILDCDDVLFDCNNTGVQLVNKKYGTNFTIYDIHEWGLTGGLIDERLEYYSDPDFIGSLPPYPGAKEFVAKLCKKAEVFIMTNVQPACASVRFEAIVKHFPEINPSNIIIGGRKDLVYANMMLDDAYHNLENSLVTHPVLFQRPWNYGKAGVLSVNGYDEFLQLVDIIKTSEIEEPTNVEVVSLVGPSGSNKKRLAEKLLSTGKFERVKTYTTKQNPSYYVLTTEEFTKRQNEGFFSEVSVYASEFYGIRMDDITTIINHGKIPLTILDINGAVSLRQHFNALNVFVKSPKEDCIKDILGRNLPIEEAVQRIASLDIEFKNEELCDITVSNLQYEQILKRVGVVAK